MMNRDGKLYHSSVSLFFACSVLFYMYASILRMLPSVIFDDLVNTYHLSSLSLSHLAATSYYVFVPVQVLAGFMLDRHSSGRFISVTVLLASLGVALLANGRYFWLAELGELFIGCGVAFAFVGILRFSLMRLNVVYSSLLLGCIIGLGKLSEFIGDIFLSSLLQSEGWRLLCYFLASGGLLLALALLVTAKRETVSVSNSLVNYKEEVMRLMRSRQLWLTLAVGCLLYLPYSAFAETWGVHYLMVVNHLLRENAIFAVSLIFLGFAVGAPLVGGISCLISQCQYIISFGAVASTLFFTTILLIPSLPLHVIYALLFSLGISSSVLILVFINVKDIVYKPLLGFSLALTNAALMLSGFLMWILGSAVKGSWQQLPKIDSSVIFYTELRNYQLSFLLIPIGLLLAVLLSFYLQREQAPV
jgi:MFS family permease